MEYLIMSYTVILYITPLIFFNLNTEPETQVVTKRKIFSKTFLDNLNIICKNGPIKNYLDLYCNDEITKLKTENLEIRKLSDENQKKLFKLFKIIKKYDFDAQTMREYFKLLYHALKECFENPEDIPKSISNILIEFNHNYKYIENKIERIYDKIKKGEIFEFKLNINDMVKRYKSFYKKLILLLEQSRNKKIIKFDDFVGISYIKNARIRCFEYKKKFKGRYDIDYNFIKSLENLVQDIFKKNKVSLNFPLTDEQLDYILEFTKGDYFLKKLYYYLKTNKVGVKLNFTDFSYYVTDNLLGLHVDSIH